MYDVAIIGGGISGCALLYELARYRVSAILLEKENDVSLGTTKANSAIVHAGYDPPVGSAMARTNVAGNAIIKELCHKLDVPYRQIGSLVVAFLPEQMDTINELYRRGVQNGVPDMKVLTKEQVLQMEPNLSDSVEGALYAPSAAVVSPWELALALAQTAVKNGAEVALRSEVTAIKRQDDAFTVTAGGQSIRARFVVNSAGVSADRVAGLAGDDSFDIHPSKGEYFLLDKSQGELVRHVVFQCPGKEGKGVLVSPTAHGNLIVGPNASDSVLGDVSTTADGLAFVREKALKSVPDINFRECIRTFAGVRAVTGEEDFIVRESAAQKGLFHMAGIKSPGLTAAPAIARDVVGMLKDAGLVLEPKTDCIDTRESPRFREMSAEQRARAVKENPLYGRIVCRCETVTEAEIVAALHAPIPPVSVDGVKRRCSCGMGRCQGGFCGPRVQEIIAREGGVPFTEVPLDRDGMTLLTGETKVAQ
ncbi:MAG: NAD(P)/FAD-dependent oxidoreductase [Acetanaerobacterium sp.]